MTTPERLLDDPQLASELRTDLQRFASADAEHDLAQGWQRLQRELGPEVGISAPDAGTASAGPGGAALAIKLLVLAAIGGSVALGIQLRGQSDPTPAPKASVAAAGGASSQPAATPSSVGAVPGGSRELGASAEPVRVADPLGAPQPRASSVPRRSAAPASGEVTQLLRIKSLLETDPAAARRLIVKAQREFPTGVLAEEREALNVIALFAMGDHGRGQAAAERFLAQYPRSPLRARISELLAREEP